MRQFGSVAVAYNEERFITPHLEHLSDAIEPLVLLSTKPWFGRALDPDTTANRATRAGASLVTYHWPTEHEQRNAGQEYFLDKDWILVLDPDEFLTAADQIKLMEFLRHAPDDVEAFVCERQLTYWKSGYVVDPPEDYKQIIAVRPSVRFVDKRVVDRRWGHAPVTLHHFSWARTDAEVLNKITHYAHAEEINPNWYKEVWQQWQPHDENLHPLTPPALKRAIPAQLPPELTALNLWPSS